MGSLESGALGVGEEPAVEPGEAGPDDEPGDDPGPAPPGGVEELLAAGPVGTPPTAGSVTSGEDAPGDGADGGSDVVAEDAEDAPSDVAIVGSARVSPAVPLVPGEADGVAPDAAEPVPTVCVVASCSRPPAAGVDGGP